MTLAEIIEELRQAAAEDGMGRGACDTLAKALEALPQPETLTAARSPREIAEEVAEETCCESCAYLRHVPGEHGDYAKLKQRDADAIEAALREATAPLEAALTETRMLAWDMAQRVVATQVVWNTTYRSEFAARQSAEAALTAAREQRDEAHEALAIVESTLLAVTQVEELGKRGFSSEWVTLHEAVSAQTKHTLAEVRAVLSRAALRERIDKEKP